MKSFYIISNEQKDPGAKAAASIASYLAERGKDCSICAQRVGKKRADAGQIPDHAECALVLGGDGTLLRAARDLVKTRIPLLGVNMGTLGYLAEVDIRHIAEALDQLIRDDYTLEERMMLEGSAKLKDAAEVRDIALNDIVITRNGRVRVLDFNIYVDGVFLSSYSADGIIVSTPTGSTGYNLSAGGPIVEPQASMILLTPIAPHTLNSRTIVLPDDAAISIEVLEDRGADRSGAEAAFDGDTSVLLNAGDRIEICKAGRKTRLIKLKNTGFLEILREKMNK